MICELLKTTEDGQVTYAIIRLINGKITVERIGEPPKDIKRFEDSILKVKGWLDGQWVTARSNPEKWFYVLPETFNGRYVRARIVPAA